MATHKHRGDNLMGYLERELKVKQMELNALMSITRSINENLSAEGLFRIYELTLKAHLRIERAIVFFNDEHWQVKSHYGVEEKTRLLDVEKVLSPYLETHQFADGESRPDELEGIDLIIPVRHKEHALAYALVTYPQKESYEIMQEKVNFIETITNIITVAIENKRLFKKQLEGEGLRRELEVAVQVQEMMVPNELPEDPPMEMNAVYLPHQNVGGDYYDYMALTGYRHIFCVADISGKGIGAALLMANFQAHLNAMVKHENLLLEGMIQRLNRSVLDITRGEKYITFFIGAYSESRKELFYINAGHQPPLLFMNGEGTYLTEGCTILGMFPDLPFINLGRIPLEAPAVAVLYTDGLTDLQNDEGLYYSIEHVEHLLRQNPDVSMRTLNKMILDEIAEFKGDNPYVDDITLLSARIH